MNKITFLGCAGDAASRMQQKAGGFVISYEGAQYHVDPGPGAVASALSANVSVRANVAVLVSNNALLASEGVNDVIDAMTLSGTDKFGVLIAAKSVVEGTKNEHAIVRNDVKSWVERVFTFDETTRLGINNLTIMPKRAVLEDVSAIGFVFETAKRTIGYSPSIHESVASDFTNCDYLIIQCRNEAGEFSASQASEFIKQTKPKQAILTGFPFKTDTLALARDIQRESKVTTVAAKDGFEVTIE